MHLIGKTLGKYRIMEQIGQGDMAVVYKAYQPDMDRAHQAEVDRFVALKVVHSYYAKNPGVRERFSRDAEAIVRLSHPNILPVYDAGVEEDIYYLVMKYVPGSTLRDILGEQFPLRRAYNLVAQIAGALDHAHQMGVIHRAVKPANVLLDGEWAYLTDFGIADIVEGTVDQTGTGRLLGTPSYMSPEQAGGDKLDHRTDIYSLGVVLFEMVTGRVPFTGDTPYAVLLKLLHDSLPLPRSLRPDLPEEVERTILKALAKYPEHRYDKAGEVADALRQALASAPDPGAHIPVLGEPGISRSQNPASDAGQHGYSPSDSPQFRAPAPGRNASSRFRKTTLWTAGALIAVAVLAGGLFYTNHLIPSLRVVQEPIQRQTGLKTSLKAPIPPESTPSGGELQAGVAAKDEPLPQEEPQPKSASIEIGSTPAGAAVYVDGEPRGKAPLKSELPLGEHTIRIAMEGYQDLEHTIDIKEAKDYHLALTLTPEEHKEQAAEGRGPQDDVQSLYLAGTRYLEQKSYEDAFQVFSSAAEKGDPESQTELGYMYRHGLGVPRDDVEAARWYRKAAEQELAVAQNNMGVLTLKGEGVPKNEQQAFMWFEKAAVAGDQNGQFHLATMYLRGIGVASDRARALEWYLKAAEQGHEQAQEAVRSMGKDENR